MERLTVTLYSKEKCPLCTKAESLLEEIKEEFDFNLEIIDIYKDDELLEKYQLMIPVVCIEEDEIDFGQLSKQKIRAAIEKKLL